MQGDGRKWVMWALIWPAVQRASPPAESARPGGLLCSELFPRHSATRDWWRPFENRGAAVLGAQKALKAGERAGAACRGQGAGWGMQGLQPRLACSAKHASCFPSPAQRPAPPSLVDPGLRHGGVVHQALREPQANLALRRLNAVAAVHDVAANLAVGARGRRGGGGGGARVGNSMHSLLAPPPLLSSLCEAQAQHGWGKHAQLPSCTQRCVRLEGSC